MTHQKKSFVGAGIGIIIFILCYRLLSPPSGSSLGLRVLWLCLCPVAVSLAGLVIFGIAGLLSRSIKVFTAGLSSFIFSGSILYAVCCLSFPVEIKMLYTRMYLHENKTKRVANRNKEIKKAIEQNIKEQKNIPQASMATKPLKLIIDKLPVPQNKKTVSKVIQVAANIQPKVNSDGSGNPFNYGADELGNYIPMKGQHIIPEIAIKGILTLENNESVAALKLKNQPRAFYVRKGNVIRLQSANGNKKTSEIYLQIRNIKNNEVEIIQQQRPDKVIIIR